MATQDLHQVPPEAEVWEVDGRHFLIWYAPNTEPPIPLAWFVSSSADYKALGITKVNRKFASFDDFYATGVLRHGDSRELANTDQHPFDQIKSNYATEVKVKPWLADPEIMALWSAAALEGRSITDAELKGTEWWRTRSEAERQWLTLNAADPATADRIIEDNRIQVADLMRAAGIDNASDELSQLIADNWTTGKWSEVYATKQIQLLADPFAEGTLDAELTDMRSGLDTTAEREQEVKQMFREWLGPTYMKYLPPAELERWAGRLRNNPEQVTQDLEVFLRRQFRTHFNPGGERYGDDPDLRYGDIAPMWRGVFQQMWGKAPDETDDLFMKVVRMNDLAEAQKLLRKEGLKRGNGQVTDALVSDLAGAFGDQVRRSDPAVQ